MYFCRYSTLNFIIFSTYILPKRYIIPLCINIAYIYFMYHKYFNFIRNNFVSR